MLFTALIVSLGYLWSMHPRLVRSCINNWRSSNTRENVATRAKKCFFEIWWGGLLSQQLLDRSSWWHWTKGWRCSGSLWLFWTAKQKDVCGRILCPLKSSVQTYCFEGNDILSVHDMRDALQKHPVRGTSASVNMVDELKKSLQVKTIDHFSGFHNFTFESSGTRARRAYKIGRGKLFPYDTLYFKHQEATGLMTKDR